MQSTQPKYQIAKRLVRVLAVLFLVSGGACFFIAIRSFATPLSERVGIGDFHYFFFAIPLLFLGAILAMASSLGSITRFFLSSQRETLKDAFELKRDAMQYHLQEIAPIQKDTINYMVSGTRDSVRDVVSAISEGIRGEGTLMCPSCQARSQSSARFCHSCGEKM
ncbi:MAG: zinc ribbon domain-containing protein [Proteobacteria bacterium]|nr:zinc ribbon domain-containing protein [Pseudomonadota bacterium]